MRYAWFILAAVLSALCVWGGCGLTGHMIAALDAWRTAAPDLEPTLDAINRPCGGGQSCGTLATLNKTIVKAGDAVVSTQLAERATVPHVLATMEALATIAPHANSAMDSASKTADAAAGTAHALTDTLEEGRRTISAAQPLLGSLTRDSDDVNAFIKETSPVVTANLKHSDALLASVGATAADFHVYTHPILNPDPCTNAKCRIKRYVWPAVEGVLGLSQGVEDLRVLFGHSIPVTLR